MGLNLPAAFAEAFRARRRRDTGGPLSVLSIALALFLVGLTGFLWGNVAHLASAAETRSGLIAYLAPKATPAQVAATVSQLKAVPGVRHIEVVSARQALSEMRSTLGPNAAILQDLGGANPFTGYLIIDAGAPSVAAAQQAAAGQSDITLVQDNAPLISRLSALSRGADIGGLGVAAVAGLVALVISLHVVSLSMMARRRDMETLRLMGASERFVTFPFKVEGLLTGGGAGLLASALLLGAFPLLTRLGGAALPFLPLAPWVPLWAEAALAVTGLGLLTGAAGAQLAIRRQPR